MKKLLITTALSLALIASGASFAADANSGKTSSNYEEGMGHGKLLASLSKDKADLFRKTMKDVHQKNKELYSQIKGLKGELSAITRAASFDDKAYIAKSAEIANLRNKMNTNKTEAMAGFLSKLNQDERSKFADSIKNRRGHKGRFHKDSGTTGATDTNKQ